MLNTQEELRRPPSEMATNNNWRPCTNKNESKKSKGNTSSQAWLVQSERGSYMQSRPMLRESKVQIKS